MTDNNNNNGNGINWKISGIIGTICTVIVVGMWNLAGAVNKGRDLLEDAIESNSSKITVLQTSQSTVKDLIDWEHRFTVIEESITDLERDSHREVK